MSSTLPELIATERALLNKEAWLVAALQKIKSQRISLQVERLQLQSMLKEKNENVQSKQTDLKQENFNEKLTKAQAESHDTKSSALPIIPPIELLDQAESSYNNKKLDLSIMNDIDSIISGTYCPESDLEEVESSDEGW